MTSSEEIDAIKDRLIQARAACDAWHAAGLKEKYLEAYFLVESLELQLDRHANEPRDVDPPP